MTDEKVIELILEWALKEVRTYMEEYSWDITYPPKFKIKKRFFLFFIPIIGQREVTLNLGITARGLGTC